MQPTPPSLQPVPRALTRVDFDELVQQRQPVIFSFESARAANWAEQIFASLHGQPMAALVIDGERPPVAPPAYVSFFGSVYAFIGVSFNFSRKLTIEQAAAAGTRWIISGIDLEAPAASCALGALDELMPTGCTTDTTGCWISSAGCDTKLHFDAFGPDNFHLLTQGEKDVVLFSPAEAESLYCFGGPRYFTRFAAAVDPFRPDLRAFPLYGRASGLRTTLRVGDVLYIPAFWWHGFVHIGATNLSLTRWFYRTHQSHHRHQLALPPIPARVHLNLLRLLVIAPLCDVARWLLRWPFSFFSIMPCDTHVNSCQQP